jgi:hypothetical protein
MRFEANPDDIKSLVVTRLTYQYHTNFTAMAIIIGKNGKKEDYMIKSLQWTLV